MSVGVIPRYINIKDDSLIYFKIIGYGAEACMRMLQYDVFVVVFLFPSRSVSHYSKSLFRPQSDGFGQESREKSQRAGVSDS